MRKILVNHAGLMSALTFFMLLGNAVHANKRVKDGDPKITVTSKLLTDILEKNRSLYTEGSVADYIPELAKMDSKKVAFSVVTENGKILSVGDSDQRFTIQSISKIISLMIAVQDRGEKEVMGKSGYYGTEKPFNHFANIETKGQPLNPMMNAGAILTTSMIIGEGDEGFRKILSMIRYITNNSSIDYSEEVYLSEKMTGHRNRGIFYLLKNNGLISGDEVLLDNYFKQCSIEVTAEDLAKIGYFFANGCIRFDGDRKYENIEIAKLIQSQMFIAGMYEFSGEYARTIGLPSKSGVGGGITVSVPRKMGIGVFSPTIDKQGNSVVGYHMILDLIQKLDLSLFQ